MTAASYGTSRSERGEVVKLRLRSQVYTSPVLPHSDAVDLRNKIRRQLTDIGDAPGMIEFTDRHTRAVTIRAREVSVVEVGVPDADDDPHRGRRRRDGAISGVPSPTAGVAQLGGGMQVHVSGALGRSDDGPGDFLRRQGEAYAAGLRALDREQR